MSRALGFALTAMLLVPAPALAAPTERSREVLLVYRDDDDALLQGSSEPRAIEVVLNHLGLVVRYHNLALGLPDPALTRRVRGVVAWLDSDGVPGAQAYAEWLAARLDARQPLVLLGGLGILFDAKTGTATPRKVWTRVTEGLGLDYDGAFVGATGSVHADPSVKPPAFERPWVEPAPLYQQARSTDPANRVFLRLRRSDTGATSDQGLIGPRGAVVIGAPYVFHLNPFTYHLQWRLDPFAFLSEALHTSGEPKPDPTTVNGRRVFFAHIDGDGFANVANRPGRPLAAEVVRDDVLAQTTLPTTVSLIAREVQGKPTLEAIARSIFKRANVEPASHSFTHPFDWRRKSTARLGATSDVSASTTYGDPNAQGVQALTPEHEIDDSFRYIQTLVPAGKQVQTMLWSGATNPTAAYHARVAALGAVNLNGGDAKIDPKFPSYADLSPFGRHVGPYLQVYTGTANENLFTNLWTGPFDGQRDAIRTFEFQESPRRMAATNIYYHFYAGDRLAGAKALRELYQWAEARPHTPIWALEYARIVEGFDRAQLATEGDGVWSLRDLGACRTVRFDAEPRVPDLRLSRAVAGWNRANGSLYVHLSAADARVVLGPEGGGPRLSNANARLLRWDAAERRLAAEFEGPVALEATLAGLPPGARPKLTGAFRPQGPGVVAADGTWTIVAPPGRHACTLQW